MTTKRELPSPSPSDSDDLKPSIPSSPSPSPSTPKKKAKSTSACTPRSSPSKSQSETKNKKTPSPSAGEGKKTGAWSGEELKLLYSIMCPKRTGVNWADVSQQIPGRDAKSCNNKWSRVQSKIIKAIEDLGE